MVPHRSVQLALVGAALAVFLGLTPWAGGAVGATCDTSWASAASGFWDLAGNWTAGVPDGTKNACITLAGTYTVTVRGSRSAAGITLGGSSGQQTLQVVGDATNGNAALTLANQGSASDGLLANGRLVLTSSGGAFNAFLNDGSNVLTNNGQIVVGVGAGGLRLLYGGVDNTATGTVTINQPTDSNNAGQWTNAGTITIAGGAALTHIGPLTTTGTLTIGTGATFGQTGNFSWPSGAITNNGSFTSYTGTFTTGTGSVSGNPVVLLNKTVSPNGSGSASLTVHGNSTLASDVAAGYPLTLEATGTDGNASLNYSADRTSNAPIHLTSTGALYDTFLNGGTNVLTNNGQISVDAGAGGLRYLNTGVNNTAGHTVTINKSTDSNGVGQWTNAGTITIASGMALTHIGPFTTSGTLTIGTGATFGQTGNFSWPSGAITNNGSFTSYTGTFTTGTGSVSGNPVVLLNKTVSPNGSGSASLTVHGNSTLASDVAAGYPLTLEATGTDGNASLNYGADRTSNAPIHLTSTSAAFQASLNGNSSVLTNNASLTIDAGAGGQRYLYGGVNNTATGTITVNRTVQGNNMAWTSAGKVTVAGGQTLQLGTVSLTLNGGTLSGNGTVEATVTNVAGNVTPGGSPGKLTISGSYTQQTKGKLTVDIKGASPGQFDVLAVTGAATLSGTLVLKPAPTFTGTVGQQFPVLTAGSYTGTFTELSKAVIDANAGTYYQPTYPGGAPTLVVTQATFSAPASGVRGAQITVSGTAWIPGKKVTISLTDSLLVTTTLKSVTADGTGSFSTKVTIPAGAATGNGTINAKGAITALTMTRPITIT